MNRPLAHSSTPRAVRRLRPHLAAALLVVTAACGPGVASEVPEPSPVELAIQPLANLDDDTAPILARPGEVHGTSAGVYVISDYSDKNLKLYGPHGKRLGAVGRAGGGPGEFATLWAAGVFRDSVWGFDFRKISLFGPDGRLARTIPVRGPTLGVQAVDDSLFLLLRGTAPGPRKLLTLIRPDGSVASSFFDRSEYLGKSPQVVENSGVIADARDGLVYAGLKGGDSLFVFDYSGKQVAAGPIDPEKPLASYRALAARGGGQLRLPNGTWSIDGVDVLIGIVGMDEGRAILHVAPYSTQTGLDRVEGGRLVAVAPGPGGTVRTVGKVEAPAGLMGRSRSGVPLLLGYQEGNTERYVLSRLNLQPKSGQ